MRANAATGQAAMWEAQAQFDAARRSSRYYAPATGRRGAPTESVSRESMIEEFVAEHWQAERQPQELVDQATAPIKASRAEAHANGDPKAETGMLLALGGTYLQHGWAPEAESAFRMSLNIAYDRHDRFGQAAAWSGIGSVLAGQGQLRDAVRAQWKCLQLCQELGHRRGEAWSQFDLGATRAMLERIDSARDALHEASRISAEEKDDDPEFYGPLAERADELLVAIDEAEHPREARRRGISRLFRRR